MQRSKCLYFLHYFLVLGLGSAVKTDEKEEDLITKQNDNCVLEQALASSGTAKNSLIKCLPVA